MKFLKLNKIAQIGGEIEPVFINPPAIQFIKPNKFQTDDGFGTFISFNGDSDNSDNYINVKESYQEVLHLLETFDDICDLSQPKEFLMGKAKVIFIYW